VIVEFWCACGASVKAKEELAGRDIRCPSCGNDVCVPGGKLPPAEEPMAIPAPPREENRVPCPMCAEPIVRAAKLCRFCGYVLDQRLASAAAPANPNDGVHGFDWIFVGIVGLVGLIPCIGVVITGALALTNLVQQRPKRAAVFGILAAIGLGVSFLLTMIPAMSRGW